MGFTGVGAVVGGFSTGKWSSKNAIIGTVAGLVGCFVFLCMSKIVVECLHSDKSQNNDKNDNLISLSTSFQKVKD
jgi:zinc transporter ZupT